jgi:hypothetical protein
LIQLATYSLHSQNGTIIIIILPLLYFPLLAHAAHPPPPLCIVSTCTATFFDLVGLRTAKRNIDLTGRWSESIKIMRGGSHSPHSISIEVP